MKISRTLTTASRWKLHAYSSSSRHSITSSCSSSLTLLLFLRHFLLLQFILPFFITSPFFKEGFLLLLNIIYLLVLLLLFPFLLSPSSCSSTFNPFFPFLLHQLLSFLPPPSPAQQFLLHNYGDSEMFHKCRRWPCACVRVSECTV